MQRPGKKGKAHKPPQAGKQAAASFGANKPKPKPKSSGPKSSEGSLFWRVITIIAVLLAIAVGYWFYAKVSRASAGEHSKTPFGTQAHRDLLKKLHAEIAKFKETGKINISILGGGMGSLTTAFYLANSSIADMLNITVYHMGWRLGGKAATGRNMTDGFGARIEEHGIHMLFGFYHNAWQMLRTIYDDLARPSTHPLATLDQAMTNHDEITFVEERNGSWEKWPIVFPPYGADPWKRPPQPIKLGLKTPACLSLQFASRWMFQLLHLPSPSNELVEFLTDLVTKVVSTTGDCDGKPDSELSHLMVAVIEFLQTILKLLRTVTGKSTDACDFNDAALRHVCWMTQLGLSNLKGLLRDQPTNFDDLDKYDYLEWCLSNGLPKELSDIPPIQSIYISGFAWVDGNLTRPDYAAGSALQTVLLTGGDYQGQWAYYMDAGTGDTLVAPLYQWLIKKGVQVKFFHKMVGLHPSADGEALDSIDIEVQAKLKDKTPGATYDPFIYLKNGLEAWPSEPNYDQLEGGESLKQWNFESYWSSGYPSETISLRRGVDFDFAVSGVSAGPLQYYAKPLMAASPKFNQMVQDFEYSPTFSIQLWFDKTADDLGAHGVGNDTYNCVAYAPPFYGAVDYKHVIEYEEWDLQAPPNVGKDVLYFSLSWQPLPGDHPFTDSSYPDEELAHLVEVGEQWLNKYLQWMYPGATYVNGTMDQNRFVPFQRYDKQFFKVNIDPSELYVLTPTGKTLSRLPPQNSTFINLMLAGDYTLNGVNIGCIESTVRSGIMAAQGIIDVAESVFAKGWYINPVDKALTRNAKCQELFQREYCTGDEAVAAEAQCQESVSKCANNPDMCFELEPTSSYCYPDTSLCPTPVPGNCSWYSNCLEEHYKCGINGYPLGYGNYYCREFFHTCPGLSTFGQEWCVVTRTCLIATGAKLLLQPGNDNYTCAQVKDIAFDSHPICYTQPQASFCDLSVDDIEKIISGFRLKDVVNVDTIKQIESVVEICLKQGREELRDILHKIAARI